MKPPFLGAKLYGIAEDFIDISDKGLQVHARFAVSYYMMTKFYCLDRECDSLLDYMIQQEATI